MEVPESQAGFRAHRGTRDATTILSLLMESALREGRKIIAVFLDFKNAFSTISHKYMDRVLKRAKVSTKIRTLIRSIYTHAHGKVRQQNADGSHEFSAAFDINRGVIQGDIFSPVVFIAGLAGIMDMALTPDHRAKLVRDGSLTVGDECYADDTALFAELSKEESEGKTDAEIRNKLTKVATTKATRFATQAYDIAALEVKPSKTNGMIIEHHAKCSITEADILEAAKSWKHRCPDCNRGFHTKSSMYTHQNLQCQMPATEKHWTVDKVVDTCTCLNGRHFRVRWTGSDDEGDPWPDTWEPSFRFCDESKTAKLAKEVSFTDGPTTIRPNNYCGAPDDIEVTPSTQAPTTPCLARTSPRHTTKSGDGTAT